MVRIRLFLLGGFEKTNFLTIHPLKMLPVLFKVMFLDALASLRPIMQIASLEPRLPTMSTTNNVNIANNVKIANNVNITNNVSIANNVYMSQYFRIS